MGDIEVTLALGSGVEMITFKAQCSHKPAGSEGNTWVELEAKLKI